MGDRVVGRAFIAVPARTRCRGASGRPYAERSIRHSRELPLLECYRIAEAVSIRVRRRYSSIHRSGVLF